MTTLTPTPLAMPGADAGRQAVAAIVAGGTEPPLPAPAGTPQAPQPLPAQPATPAAPEAPAKQPPPWATGETQFSPEQAWKTIQNLRAIEAQFEAYKRDSDPIIAEHAEQRRKGLSDNQRLTEDLTRTTTQLDAWRGQAVRSTAEAMAGSRFIDTDAALALVGDLGQFAGADRVDTDRLSAAFDKLAADKPHLVASQQQQPQGFTPNRGQGASGMPTGPSQVAAHAASQGDWRGSLAAKTQQLLAIPRT
jgi:hypothetical protein